MLFDLRGRGRRRAVRAIYFSLALLMGGGLVLFGVGGAVNGGLLDAFKNSSGTANVSDVFKKRVTAAENGVRLHPQDPKAWAQLTRVRVQQANTGYDPNKGTYNQQGLDQLRRAEAAWNRYLKVAKKPDGDVAGLMVQVYAQGALNQPIKAVSAMETVLDSRTPTGPMYAQLAALAYQAGETRKAELASAKALKLTPKDQQQDMKDQLAQIRQQASAQLSQGNGSSGSSSGPAAPTSTGILP